MIAQRPQRRALTDWTVDRLYDLVFTGVLPAGADLGEEAISKRLSVSRQTTGAALRQLEQDGLAMVAAGNGRRVVAAFDVHDILDLYNVRSLLEVYATGEAARLDAPSRRALVLKLEALQREMEALSRTEGDPSARDFGADFDFHREIAHAAGSKRVEAALRPTWNQTHALLRHLHQVGVYADAMEDAAAYADHRTIIDALSLGDEDAASQAMRGHLQGRSHRLVEGVRRAMFDHAKTSDDRG